MAIDFGPLELLRTQMQHAADAAAIAAVVHLNGQDGARDRAESVARDSMAQLSNVPSGGGATALGVAAVNFYSTYAPTPEAATTDLEAKAVEVVLQPRPANILFSAVLNLISGASATASTQTLNARAVATVRPYVCHAPPLMMCDLTEEVPLLDPAAPANVGRQIRLKEPQSGGGTWAPGNFGLLSLPDGSSGAVAIEGALGAVEPEDCYEIDVITATGSKTNKVKNGINTRFDTSSLPDPPAPNVINYPMDVELVADPDAKMGSGDWNIDAYWAAKHGGAATPGALDGATRYQTYLYEIGVPYGQNGKNTYYPIDANMAASYLTVTPLGPDIPVDLADPYNPAVDGVPQSAVAPNGPVRRLVAVALLQCVADGINGKGTYPTHGKYVEMFITQAVEDPPNAAIYGEIVRTLSSINDPEYHANAELVE